MKSYKRKLSFTGILASLLTLALSATVSAHVVVHPSEVLTADYQTFTVSVPNESDIPVTSIKLLIPTDLKSVMPTVKPGWQVNLERVDGGNVSSITWTGSMPAEFRDDFSFSAQAPDKVTDLQWKAYQTYEDGSITSWDQAGDEFVEASDSGPFSVTKVVAETDASSTLKQATQAANDAKTSARRAQYLSIAALAIGLVGLSVATRNKK